MKNKTFVVLIIIFLFVIFTGRYLFNSQNQDLSAIHQEPYGTSSVATESSTDEEEATPTSTLSKDDNPAPSCTELVRADIQQKKQSYAKGQILVTFLPEIDYANAKEVLAVYGLVVQNEVDSQSTFKSLRLITAAVAPGQEITKVCQLRSDSHVRNAVLDTYFGLHE